MTNKYEDNINYVNKYSLNFKNPTINLIYWKLLQSLRNNSCYIYNLRM